MKSLVEYFKKQVQGGEWLVLIWSFLYFFFLLTGYFILRPIREEMGVTAGTENYGWLFLSTFVVMILIQPLYGKIVSRYSRKQFIPFIYSGFGFFILLLWLLFSQFGSDNVALARIFFVFVSVYNLFVVSVFWSFMADVYTKEQGKRLFGVIAAGGSTGGIAGGLITSALVKNFGTVNLLMVSLFFLILSIVCVYQVRRFATDSEINKEAPLGGSPIEGFKLLLDSKFLQQIAIMTVTATIIGSMFYYLQGEYVKSFSLDQDTRTDIFAKVNTFTNSLTLFFQLILIPFLLQKTQIHRILGIYPCLMVFTFLLFGALPVIQVVLGGIILQRSGAYGIMKPPTDWLFTGLSNNIKYKFKNFLDTVLYRGGDVFAQLIFVNLLLMISKDLRVFAIAGCILSLLWLWNAITVGKMAIEQAGLDSK